MTQIKTIRIATRKSKLALWQAHYVKSAIEKQHPDIHVSFVEMTTEGDQNQQVALTKIGGKSLFVKSLQNALLHHDADIAVHSIKDMSVQETNGLTLAAICERADPRDAFLSNDYADLLSLPQNAVVGTASPRRESLMKSLRPDISITLLRGNVDTRLAKLQNKEYDAIVLAAAGLHRLQLTHHIRSYFAEDFFTPAIGQGAIGIECREADQALQTLLQSLNHADTARCVTTERAVNKILGGDCHTPIGAHAIIHDGVMQLNAMIASLDGKQIYRAHATAALNDASEIALGTRVAQDLLAQGAKDLLDHA